MYFAQPSFCIFEWCELKIWILVIVKAALASQRQPFWPYKAVSFQTFWTPSISKQFSVTKIQIFSFWKEKYSSVWSYDKNVPLNKINIKVQTKSILAILFHSSYLRFFGPMWLALGLVLQGRSPWTFWAMRQIFVWGFVAWRHGRRNQWFFPSLNLLPFFQTSACK